MAEINLSASYLGNAFGSGNGTLGLFNRLIPLFLFYSNYWWSGVETDGTSVDGVTADCTDWTDSTNVVAGYYGDYQFADGRWIKGAVGGACDQMLAIVCVGY